MRGILFRGKRLDNGRGVLSPWIEGHYFQTPLTEESVIGAQQSDGMFFLTGKKRHVIEKDGCVYEIDPDTVGQFTGLTDKNDKKIFEGDIFRTSLGFVAVVEWEKEGRFLGFMVGGERRVMYISRAPAVEVVGNIHDNPDLLPVTP